MNRLRPFPQGEADAKLVSTPVTETTEQRRIREKLGQPLPHVAYVACRAEAKGRR